MLEPRSRMAGIIRSVRAPTTLAYRSLRVSKPVQSHTRDLADSSLPAQISHLLASETKKGMLLYIRKQIADGIVVDV
jgi:hypothetical protein